MTDAERAAYAAGADAMREAAAEKADELSRQDDKASTESWARGSDYDAHDLRERAAAAETVAAAIRALPLPRETEKGTERLLIEKMKELRKELAEARRALIVVRNAVNEVL